MNLNLWSGLAFILFSFRRRMGVNTPPCNPPKIRLVSATSDGLLEEDFNCGRKRFERGQGGKGLAREGTRLPSGARSTQPQPDGPGSGAKTC